MTEQPLLVRGASVALDGRPVLRQVDLDVHAGELVALLGENGSGKSTLVRSVVGLVPMQAGTVELFGTPLATFRQRHRLGYVPQQLRTVTGVPATVREVAMTGRLSRRRTFGFATKDDRMAVDRALERAGLLHRADSPVSDLSGGQQQRVRMARALAGQAELLIMDEPTAGVDFVNQDSLADMLGGLVRAGTAVLLVAHELGPLRPLVDRAVVLRDGQVAYRGPVDALDHDEFHIHHHSDEPERPDGFTSAGVVWQ